MPTLVWNDTLALGNERMDTTHREFADLLAAAEAALDADRPQQVTTFGALVAHTVEHFAQEDRWMEDCGFTPDNCHRRQHAHVLAVMQEVLRLARDEGQTAHLPRVLAELADWFPMHAHMMDAALAAHLVSVGYDAETHRASRLPKDLAPISSCGSPGCTPA